MKLVKKFIFGLCLFSLCAFIFADENDEYIDQINYNVKLSYPHSKNCSSFNKVIDNTVKKIYADFAQNYLKQDYSKATFNANFELILEAGELYEDEDYISVILAPYYFTGGAHGYSGFYSINYSVKQKKVLSLKDVLGKNYKKSLEKISKEAKAELIRLAQKENIPFEMETIDEITEPKLENFQNFQITKEALIIQFDEYTAWPRVYGAPQISLPLEKIK